MTLLAGERSGHATVYWKTGTRCRCLFAGKKDHHVSHVFGPHGCFEEIALPVVVREIVGIQAAGFHSIRTDLIPESGRDRFVSKDGIRVDHVHPHTVLRQFECCDF